MTKKDLLQMLDRHNDSDNIVVIDKDGNKLEILQLIKDGICLGIITK